ncbi:MAG: hypothetical protein ACKPBV_10045 [Sphaerospermopsis kisseleviana]
MKRILASAAVMMVAVSVLGWGGPISSPELGFAAGTSKEAITKIMQYLRKEVTFVDGNFINEHTYQGYSGSARKLDELIKLLHDVGKFQMKVSFANLKDDRITFSISQNMREQALTITINTARKDLDLSELTIRIPSPEGSIEPTAPPNAATPRR